MTEVTPPQINDDLKFQSWFWAAQRVAWMLLGVLIGAALLGFTGGSGRYAQGVVGDGFYSISYPAITRRQTESMFEITIDSAGPEAMLQFDSNFQRTFTILSMSPPAVDGFATTSGVSYRFALAGRGPKTVRIAVTAKVSGTVDYSIVVHGRTASLSSVVLP